MQDSISEKENAGGMQSAHVLPSLATEPELAAEGIEAARQQPVETKRKEWKAIPDTHTTSLPNSVEHEDAWSVWSTRGKKTIVLSASFASLLAPLASNIYFPALEPIARDLDVSNTLVNVSISTFIILQGIAPTFSAQLSDSAGRRPIYLVCLTLFLAANIGLGAQNSYAALLTLRCFQSAGSSGIAALSGAIAADIATPAERGTYVSFASALPMLATAVVCTQSFFLSNNPSDID